MMSLSIQADTVVAFADTEDEEKLRKLLEKLRQLGIEARIIHASRCG